MKSWFRMVDLQPGWAQQVNKTSFAFGEEEANKSEEKTEWRDSFTFLFAENGYRPLILD